MLMLQLPIAKQQDQLWPDLVYNGFANNFAVAMQDKGTHLWRNTRAAGGGNISGPAAQEASVTTPEGKASDLSSQITEMISGLTWSSEAAGELVRSIWRETLYLMLMRARRTSRPGRDLACSIRSCQPD